MVSLLELEVGLQALGATVGAVGDGFERVRAALLAAAADADDAPHASAGESQMLVPLSTFVRAYSRAAAQLTASSMARQLDMAFAAFDRDRDGAVTPAELAEGLAAAATAPLDEARVAQLVDELDADRDGLITREEYSEWMVGRYRAVLEASA